MSTSSGKTPTSAAPTTTGKAEPSLARSSALMAAGTMVSRILGLARTSLMAYVFLGLSRANDAFNVANTLPNYVFMLLSAGLLNAVLIPQITKAMKREDAGQDFIDRVLTACFALLAVTAVLATLAAPLLVRIMAPTITGASYDLTVFFAYVCLPQIFFYGLYAVVGQLLNARGQFAAFMWTPVLANIVQIAGLLVFILQYGRHGAPGEWNSGMIWLLAGSSTLGIAVQALGLLIPLYRGGYRYTPRWGLRGQGLGTASKMALWSLASLAVSQLGGIITTRILTTIGQQHPEAPSVTAQQYAFLMFMLPHSFITTSILTALFPRMSRAANDGRKQELRSHLVQGFRMPAAAIIPASFAMIALAVPGLSAVFMMSSADVRVVALVMSIMAIGLAPFALTSLTGRYCFAVENGPANLWIQVVITGVSVVIAALAFAAPANSAVLIVALGMTVGNTVAALAFTWWVQRSLGGLPLGEVLRLYVRLTLVSVIAGAAAWLLVQGIYAIVPTTYLTHLLALAAGGAAFLAVFVPLSRMLHIREVQSMINPVLRRLRLA